MKPIRLTSAIAIAALLGSSCQKKSVEVSNKVAELERQANEAVTRQQELERRLEEQQRDHERDALERERMKIEEERAELERQRENTTEEQATLLRTREQELAARESKVDQLRSKLEDQASDLDSRGQDLDEKERELAGREAIRFDADNSDSAPVGDYGSFYDSLSPYGNWFETADYGYVWQPLIVSDSTWRPYTRGHWACTDRGWCWISDEPFGWACYHYGRWALCQGYGWVWVPGSEWAPSWVCWRSGGSHVGWAPLPPETLAYRGHHWDSSVEVACGISALWFNFVSIHDFGNPIQYHCLPYTQNSIYINETVNCTNINYYNRRVICGGPFYGDIQRQTARKPPFYRIEEDRGIRPGRDPLAMRPKVSGNRLRVAAPNLDADWNDSLMPEKVKRRLDTVKIARTEEVKPEIANRYRQTREENQRRADQTVAGLGGSEKFFEKRTETLEGNRVRIEENRGGKSKWTTESGREIQLGDVSKERAKEILDRGIRMGRNPNLPPGQAKLRTPSTNDNTASNNNRTEERGNPPQITPPGYRNDRPQENVASNPQTRQEQARNHPQVRPSTPDPSAAGNQRTDGPRVTPPRGMDRQTQDDSAANTRRQQNEQADRIRVQQDAQRQSDETRQRQEENRRQQQMEENRREQARQQQEENRRQQQQEENRREQARQQQEESRRQQQMEESRREQARQQQEESRRQQQQEESRREQARQEQQRQEQQRQEQQKQDDERKHRNR